MMIKPIYTIVSLVMLMSMIFLPVSAAPMPYINPTIVVLNVIPNQAVTFSGSNFLANDNLDVYMGYQGTQGINGIKVGTVNSGSGNFTATVNIPPALAGQPTIALRVQSAYSGVYSYNWFFNTSSYASQPGPLPQYGVPTFSIVGVIRDQSVTIITSNFPMNDLFDVTMGYYGTQGINGIRVATINSGFGGSFTTSFDIPAALYGQDRIAIRLQSPYSGYYAYNWFYNQTTMNAVPLVNNPYSQLYPTPYANPAYNPYINPYNNYYVDYYGIPTFSITSVIKDLSVTVFTFNFPPNTVFDVYMGGDNTASNPGIKVTSFNSGRGGSFSASFNIPSSLAGSSVITIRMQSPYSAYYSYNWFYNNTYP